MLLRQICHGSRAMSTEHHRNLVSSRRTSEVEPNGVVLSGEVLPEREDILKECVSPIKV
jgi:hypothetical protein